jgi:hypothetical protein
MGIQLKNVNKNNLMAVIRLHRTSNILNWIPSHLINSEVCLAAVQANGLALKHVPNNFSTREVRLAAIWENHQALWTISRCLIDATLIDAAFESLILQCKAARYLTY